MRYGEWRDRGGVSNRAPTPPNAEPDVSAPDHVEPMRDALFSPLPSPAFAPPAPTPSPEHMDTTEPASPSPAPDDTETQASPHDQPAEKPRRKRRSQTEMAASRFDRGTPIATRSRVTVARHGALCVGALLLSSWQTIAADGMSSGRALKAQSSSDPRNHREAMATDEKSWRPAELAEIENHRTNGTWTEVDFSAVPTDRRRLVRMT
jgi:type IV secretory pathway VirB10-like protein